VRLNQRRGSAGASGYWEGREQEEVAGVPDVVGIGRGFMQMGGTLIRPFCFTILYHNLLFYSLIYFTFRDDTYVISSVFTCLMIIGGFAAGVRILLEKGRSRHHISKIRKIPKKI
jgi:hypothetical protein